VAKSLNEFITEETLVKFLEISKSKLYRLRTAEGLPFIKLGDKVVYHEPSVVEWLKGKQEILVSDVDE